MASIARVVEILCARVEGERFVIACEVLSGTYGGCWLEVIDNELEPDRTEKFGDSCVICAASVTVEDYGSATLALTCLRAPTHVHGKNMHARTHGSARAHARTR